MPPSRPMSISQLCQDDNLHGVKRELDQDPPDLYLGDDDLESSYMNNGDVDDYAHRDIECDYAAQDPEQLAAEALGDMANRGSFVAAPFISRMSSLPIVNSALKAYESGKQNSKVMKYGAEMVESSVKSLSKPVFDKLEPKLGQLDDFACRQLDKFEKVYPKSEAQAFPSPTSSARSSYDLLRQDNGSESYFVQRPRGDSIDSTSSSSSRPSFDILRSRNPRHEEATTRRSDSQSRHPTSTFQFSSGQSNGLHSSQRDSHIGSLSAPSQQFSGWKGVVATVGSASAAGVAIFSEESMKSLKYCLQWLQYAVQHIDHQIGLLRAFLVSLANPSQNTEIVPSTAASTLASIKKEVVETLRKVINVVSRYAGACLPDQAKINVRQFILSMPVRWATLNNESVPSTPVGSPSLGPVDRSPEHAALNDTAERATKVLIFANESSDMLRSVSTIFKDSVDKAESWMDKLRYVGMAPQNNDGLPSWAPTGFPGSPGGTMPGGFPGASGLEQYSLRQSHHSNPRSRNGSPTRSLKNSPRLGSRDSLHSMSSHHSSHLLNSRHLYRQKSVMSGDEDSASDDDTLAMDDSDDDTASHQSSNGHGPLKRSMGSHLLAPDNSVRRRKKRGESAEVIAGLGISSNGQVIKQESF
ncbi:hypothetical protein BG006_008761 [Podila minutissima]|uniref:Opi1-domain-containing protein n=1 Tax=Podila minutissima TaxID=64525 RepID=A0A9P5VJQ2_9FUNG|nr:hypothetical protein BG006_008761 [Podila minutissima]